MGLKCGIIGLPNVGKSTIFNTLTNLEVPSKNFPFCTINPNIGFAPVFDRRLIELKNIVHPRNVLKTFIKIVDIAGLVKGASQGEGLGNNFLSQIREVDSLIHVVRSFENKNIIHVHNKIDPIKDIKVINEELILSDLDICKKNLSSNKPPKGVDQDFFLKEKKVLKKCLFHLKNFFLLRNINFSLEELSYIKKFKFLTLKPTLFLININSCEKSNSSLSEIQDFLKNDNFKMFFPKIIDKNKLKENYLNTNVSEIINSIYQTLNLETFFTVGKNEVRAWPFIKNSKSIEVAKIIHSDFSKGYIRAKVISYLDFIKYKSEQKVKEFGKLRLEGKNYIVKDGDIIHFLFNV